jgi:hypothetical protein
MKALSREITLFIIDAYGTGEMLLSTVKIFCKYLAKSIVHGA